MACSGTILLIFCLLSGVLSGQNLVAKNISFQQLNTSNGLSNNNVTDIVTDHLGFLWIGTGGGLNVFDGHNVNVFTIANTPALPSDQITALLCDSGNRVWIGTTSGVALLDENRQFHRIHFIDTLSNYSVRHILQTATHGVIIYSDKGHFYFNQKNKKWELLPISTAIKFQQRVVDASLFSPDCLLVCDEFESVILFDYKQKKEQLRMPLKYVVTACRYDDSTILASTFTGKISFININSQKIRETFTITTKAGNSASSLSLVKMRLMAGGDLFITTYYDGIFIMNPRTKKYIQYKHELNNPTSIPGNRTQHIYCEKNGNVFFTTANSGLSFFNVLDKPVKAMNVFIDKRGEFFDGPLNMITKDKDGIFWIGAIDRLIRWDAQKNTSDFFYYSYPRKGVPDHKAIEIFCVCIDNNNNVWVGTSGGGFGILNKANRKFEVYSTEFRNQDSAIKSNYIRQMVKDSDGKIWAVTNMGILQIDPATKTIIKFDDHPLLKQIADKRIYSVYLDRQQRIWFGGGNIGAYCWDKKNHSLKHFSTTNGLPSMQCNSFLLTRNGEMYIATPEGLAFIRNGSVVNVYNQSNGLRNLKCQSLQEDEAGNIWIANDNCMIAFDPVKKSFRYFDKKNGFGDFGFRIRSSFISEDGRLFWGNERGLFSFYPVDLLSSNANPNPIIFKLRIGDSSMFITSDEIITQPAASNNIAFYFSSVNVLGNRNTSYRYRLAGTDEDWNQVMDQNEVHYSYLPPGKYEFWLKASADGVNWVNAPYSVRIKIVPPFWKTFWFISALALLLLSGLFFWIRSLRRRVKEEKILTYFATSLYGQNTVEDIFWDIAKNCISQLRLEDCVIYQYDVMKKVLVQKAAYGPKNPKQHEISNVLEIPLGQGIVGGAAASGQPIIVRNTVKDDRYIIDDRKRKSEIAVPIFVSGNLFGVIDSEHSRKNYYSRWHLRLLKKIAQISSDKISKYIAIDQVRTNIARDLHDEIGSALTSINVLSQVALTKGDENLEIKSYLNLISQTTFGSMENMSDIVWAINPRNDKLDALMSRMKEFAANLCEALDIDLDFHLPARLENIPLKLATRKNLFLIFKEAVNNSVKYSECTVLKARFELKDTRLVMAIEDNGKGFNQDKKPTGNGLRNMMERTLECDGKIQIGSTPAKGTTIIVEIPIPQIGSTMDNLTI